MVFVPDGNDKIHIDNDKDDQMADNHSTWDKEVRGIITGKDHRYPQPKYGMICNLPLLSFQ